MSFVHLHVHSLYSPMAGVSSLEDLCQAARAHGAEALALTDTNGMYGAIRFIEVARYAGLQPILGAELVYHHHRAVLLAKSIEGYANLCRVLSARHSDGDFDFISAVARYRAGLIILSDDASAVTAWKKDSQDDLYIELTPGAMMHQALAFSRQIGLPPVATNRVHFVRPQEFEIHRLLRAIACKATMTSLQPEDCCGSSHWFMPPSTFAQYFPHVPHALTNTNHIAKKCHVNWDFKETIFPTFRQMPDEDASTLLRKKTYAGAHVRYGSCAQEPRVQERIERELAVICNKGYAHYFLVVDEIVQQAPRTCGRGSAAASIVSYCLGITHVDPIQHNLFFERFLNPGRHDPPDIDIDFPWDERDRILDFIFMRYGAARAAMVANQNTLAPRAAMRELAKVYGLSPTEVNHVSQQFERGLHTQRSTSDPWKDIFEMAPQLEGHFRHLALHCGGIVIVPDEIRRYVPVEVAAKGVPVIQWEKDQCEDAGLVKIDILGNRSLAVIRDAVDAVARHTGVCLDPMTWNPLADSPTRDVIRRAETIGCFYIESPATRQLLTKLWKAMPTDRRDKADVFDYLVVVSSLVRPAANRFVQEFVRRAHGGTYAPLHPLLEEELAETHGIMIYQEDVTKVAVRLAGFSIEDGDQLRKVLTKKHKQRQLQDYREQFCRGAMRNGASWATVQAIWDMIMSFAGYSFCKPHSASYAQVSFKSAYLRIHYPAEFMAAVISNQGGFYSTFAYVSEARRMGLAILPPDVNTSEWAYVGKGRAIRVGFMQIKHLTRAFADHILAERQRRGPFRSWQDFLTRVNPDLAQAVRFIKLGCCDSIAGELTRPALLWRLHAWVRSRNAHLSSGHTHGMSQASLVDEHSHSPLPIPDEYSEMRQAWYEMEVLGFCLSKHPIELFRCQRVSCGEYVSACEMHRYVGKRVSMLGWLITGKSVQTKDGDAMEFVSFEDQTGLYETTLFPRTHRRYRHLLSSTRPQVLEGVVEEEFGAITLTVSKVMLVGAAQGGTRAS